MAQTPTVISQTALLKVATGLLLWFSLAAGFGIWAVGDVLEKFGAKNEQHHAR